jgi:hypothetical protein
MNPRLGLAAFATAFATATIAVKNIGSLAITIIVGSVVKPSVGFLDAHNGFFLFIAPKGTHKLLR